MRSLPIFTLMSLLMGCASTEPQPAQVWSEGCTQLTLKQDVYQFSGLACSYLEFPKIDFRRNHDFSVQGTLYSFNGYDYGSIQTSVSGKLVVALKVSDLVRDRVDQPQTGIATGQQPAGTG